MRVVVTDVSVFFDLFEIQVLPEFFALDWEIHIIGSTRGIGLLEDLKMTNNRLPIDLIDKLIRQWKAKKGL